MQEVFGFVKRNLSGAQRRKDAASGERGAGKGAAALVPASAHSGPEREQRSESGLTGLVNTAPSGAIYWTAPDDGGFVGGNVMWVIMSAA